MLSFDFTFVLVLISFLLFVLAMNELFFKPITAIEAKRLAHMQGLRQATDDLLSKCQILQTQHQQTLTAARKQAQALMHEVRQKAKAEAATLLQAARENAQAHLNQQLATLMETKNQLQQALQPEQAALSQLLLARLVPAKKAPKTAVGGAR